MPLVLLKPALEAVALQGNITYESLEHKLLKSMLARGRGAIERESVSIVNV